MSTFTKFSQMTNFVHQLSVFNRRAWLITRVEHAAFCPSRIELQLWSSGVRARCNDEINAYVLNCRFTLKIAATVPRDIAMLCKWSITKAESTRIVSCFFDLQSALRCIHEIHSNGRSRADDQLYLVDLNAAFPKTVTLFLTFRKPLFVWVSPSNPYKVNAVHKSG